MIRILLLGFALVLTALAVTAETLTDMQMLDLAKAKVTELQQSDKAYQHARLEELASNNQHMGGARTIPQPLALHRFWNVHLAYTPAAPARKYLAVSRSGEVTYPVTAEQLGGWLKQEDTAHWNDDRWLDFAKLYIHLTTVANQDGWTVLWSPQDFLRITINMEAVGGSATEREKAAQAITAPKIDRAKDTATVTLYTWQLIGGGLKKWTIESTPAGLKATPTELGQFGGGGYD